MLNRYLISAALAAVMAGLVAVFAFGVFGSGLSVADWSSASSENRSAHQSSPLTRSWSPLSINPHGTFDLQLAPMHALDKTELEHDRAREAKAASATHRTAQDKPKLTSPAKVPSIQKPLDLSLPSLVLPVVVDMSPTPQTSPTPAPNTTSRPSHTNPSTPDLNAGLGPSTFDDDRAHKLFNRDNGLRGFMKQSWVNQNLGFQGGLAIKPERLQKKDSDLRDNMAVGMGVLLAF